MRLVDVTSFYSRNGGGIRTYLHARSRQLCARGWQVHRIVPGETAGRHRAADGAIEHTVPGPTLPLDRNYRCFGDLRAVGRLLHELVPDVVEVGSHYVLPWVIRRLAPRGARIVGFVHSNVPDTFVAPAVRGLPPVLSGPVMQLAWRTVAAMHARYDATLCASRALEARLRDAAVPRVVRTGLGVDLEHFRPPRAPDGGDGADGADSAGGGQLCYVGRLSRDKETGLLLQAAPALRAAGLTLRVAGDGPAARAFATAPALDYLGPVSRERVRELFWTSDVCVVPGRYETFSLAAAEALACGTPVVCAAGGAAAELALAAGAGATFAPGDPRALLAAARQLCQASAAQRRRSAQSARAFAQRELGWDRVLDRLLAVYRGEVARPREVA